MKPMAKTLSLSEVKTRLPKLLTDVAKRGETIVITRYGRPTAVLVSYRKYRGQEETLDILSDPDMMKQIRQSRRFYARRNQGLSFGNVFGEDSDRVGVDRFLGRRHNEARQAGGRA